MKERPDCEIVDGIGALRCPFCRQYPSLDYAEEQFRLLCKDENHLIDVGFHATLEQAIDAWNRRANHVKLKTITSWIALKKMS